MIANQSQARHSNELDGLDYGTFVRQHNFPFWTDDPTCEAVKMQRQ